MSESKSQLGQDLKVLNYYNNKRNGYFVEIGAVDGLQLSNTFLLEHKYDWSGICVEPIPYMYNYCLQNRPKSICSNKAIYSKSNEQVIFSIAHNNNFFSGISNHIDCHKDTVNSNKTDIIVTTITLTDLLDHNNAPEFIEYLSIDTEGSELEVLKGIDFNKYKFGLIDIEHNYIEPIRTQIRDLLLSKGYEYLGENQWDDSYGYKKMNI